MHDCHPCSVIHRLCASIWWILSELLPMIFKCHTQRVLHVSHLKGQCRSQLIQKSNVDAMGLNWSSNVAHRGFKNVIGNTKRLAICGADMVFQVRDLLNHFAIKAWYQWPSWTCHWTQTSGKSTRRWSSISSVDVHLSAVLNIHEFPPISPWHSRIHWPHFQNIWWLAEVLIQATGKYGNRFNQHWFSDSHFLCTVQQPSHWAKYTSASTFFPRSPWPIGCITNSEKRHGRLTHNSQILPEPSDTNH